MIIYFIKKYLESPKIENGFNVFSFIKQNEFESLTNIHIKIKKKIGKILIAKIHYTNK